VARQDRRSGNLFTQLNEYEQAELFIWLTHEYPHLEDPEFNEGWHTITLREDIAQFRDSIPNNLAGFGTEKACLEIQRIMQEFPHLNLRRFLVHAQENMRRKNWQPVKSKELLKLVQNSQATLVYDGAQLLEVLIVSLERLQQKLKGETPAVRDVWDKVSKNKYRPISENDFSDYVKRHFDEDINQRGIIANREVQIRRGRERTDIHINAVIRDEQRQEYDVITAIIEVKGCWHSQVMEAMESQLLDRYLKSNECQHGLYLVGWFVCDEWDSTHKSKKQVPNLSLDEFIEMLNVQAARLSSQEDKQISAFVLDARFS
jgi:hypothetical protein